MIVIFQLKSLSLPLIYDSYSISYPRKHFSDLAMKALFVDPQSKRKSEVSKITCHIYFVIYIVSFSASSNRKPLELLVLYYHLFIKTQISASFSTRYEIIICFMILKFDFQKCGYTSVTKLTTQDGTIKKNETLLFLG